MSLTRREAFNILGLSEEASEEEIRTKYRELLLLNHTDKHPPNLDPKIKEEMNIKFKEVQDAYKLLTKPPTEEKTMMHHTGYAGYGIYKAAEKRKQKNI